MRSLPTGGGGRRYETKLLTNNEGGNKIMAMLSLSFSRFSVTPRRALRAPVWFAMLAALMFAGNAWGQFDPAQKEMRTVLADRDDTISADSETAFTGQIPSGAEANVAHVTSSDFLDGDSDGFLNPDEAGVVVDWILVQTRVVPSGEAATDCVNDTTHFCQTKAVLLLSDGSVADADAESLDALKEGVVTIEEDSGFDVDAGTQDMYIAVYHRSHAAVRSMRAIVAADVDTAGDGVISYDFRLPANVLGGVTNTSEAGAGGKLGADQVAMKAGVIGDEDTDVGLVDLGVVLDLFGTSVPGGYTIDRENASGAMYPASPDVSSDGDVGLDDLSVILNNFGTGQAGFSFF